PAVTGVAAADERADGVLRLAAAAEADSEHPLARAIVSEASRNGAIPPGRAFRSMAGRGVEAEVEGRRVAVGGPTLLHERSLLEPESIRASTAGWRDRGATVLYVIQEDSVRGALAIVDGIRP